MIAFAPGNDLDRAGCAQNGVEATTPYASAKNRLYGPQSAPPELQHFVREQSVGDAALALGLARGTVHRLRQGYWPEDSRKLVQAWGRYQGQRGIVQSSWFLRRVRSGGVIRHAGLDYAAPGLAARTGQLLAVARAADGSLLAQTLELPAERLPLTQWT